MCAVSLGSPASRMKRVGHFDMNPRLIHTSPSKRMKEGGNQLEQTYCGWTKSCTTWKSLEASGWYLQGNHQKPGFLGWCEMDFAPIHSSAKKVMIRSPIA